ncbi:MAG TPA: hypothetical protein VLN58_04490 [Verrucomicrobiae bacterium]|nr:hypothetical protein [Verrucomicrobiae bacterium]
MPSSSSRSKAGYDLHPSVLMAQKTLAGLKQKTGRSLQSGFSWSGKKGLRMKSRGAHG